MRGMRSRVRGSRAGVAGGRCGRALRVDARTVLLRVWGMRGDVGRGGSGPRPGDRPVIAAVPTEVPQHAAADQAVHAIRRLLVIPTCKFHCSRTCFRNPPSTRLKDGAKGLALDLKWAERPV